MTKLAFGLFLSVGLICRSDAQLNGEFTYDIADTFGTSPYIFQDLAPGEWSEWYRIFDLRMTDNSIVIPVGTIVHNPLNGNYSLNGSVNFVTTDYAGIYVDQIFPAALNPQLAGDYWSISTSSTIKVLGKTYTDKKSKRSLLDISLGTITLRGSYTPADQAEKNITKGLLAFKASKLDCERLYNYFNYTEPAKIRLSGSVTLGKYETKKLDNKNVELTGLAWGGPSLYYESREGNEYDSDTFQSFFLDLNVTSSGSRVTGTAKVYYLFSADYIDPNKETIYTYFPSSETPAKEFNYSVKGTRKNGVATLNLTGLGVIKGLKATIYINDSTQEIIQNGKNSITLYGQTITY